MTVFQNQWHCLDVPAIGDWSPTAKVSVIVPTRDSPNRLSSLLQSLAHQTYPSDLLEIVVVDDGSEPALKLPERIGAVPVATVRRDTDGTFGAGRARNIGARDATGEVLLFLDTDILAGPRAVESLARWCLTDPAAMVTAILGFFDDEALPRDELNAAITEGSLAELLRPIASHDQSWRDNTFTRTHDLTTDAPDLFRIVIGAVMALHRDLFDRLGGLRELGVRGIEDTEFGFRAHTAGSLLVLDREAQLWHQGRRHFGTGKAAETKERREPLMQDLIAAPGFRRSSKRCPSVPSLIVDLTEVRDQAEIASWVVTDTNDVRFLVDEFQHADERFTAADAYSPRDRSAVPYQARPLAPIRVTSDTVDLLRARLQSDMLGVLHVVDERGEELLEVTSTRAVGRAVLAGVNTNDRDALVAAAGACFGEWWLPGSDVGVERSS